jgi:two-component system nitrate/nitrite response regulator NarL
VSLRTDLSPREAETVAFYVRGYTVQQTANRLGVQPSTVKGAIDRAKAKYATAGRPAYTKIELRARAVEDGIIDAHDDLTTTNTGLLGGHAWTPAGSPTAKLLGIS